MSSTSTDPIEPTSTSDEQQKEPKFKGQSRVLKVCHWCAKKQEPGAKPFQACARCKEVIYCSKECQVASWPHHKVPCKVSAEANKKLQGAPSGYAEQIAVFKKWHSTNVNILRFAFISALDLGNNPSAADTHLVLISVRLKPNHASLPVEAKYTPTGGFTLTNAEALEIFSKQGPQGVQILENAHKNAEYMKKKGGLGLAKLMLMEEETKIMDFTTIVLPSQETAKQAQEMKKQWGPDRWLERLQQELP